MATWTGVLHATRHGGMAYAVVECAAGSVAGITECQMDLCDLARVEERWVGGGGCRCSVFESRPALFSATSRCTQCPWGCAANSSAHTTAQPAVLANRCMEASGCMERFKVSIGYLPFQMTIRF